MKAVNLIPSDARRGGVGSVSSVSVAFGPAYAVVGVLVVAVVFTLIVVLTNNTISDRKAKLASLHVQAIAASAEAARLSSYATFEQTAEQRAQTVQSIAAARFPWQRAMHDLSKVVPANVSLQSLNGTTVSASTPGAAPTGTGTSTGPTFALVGCTATQDDVARLMTRLRLINGVTDVELSSSQKNTTAAPQNSGTDTKAPPTGCPANWPTFNLSVTFEPVPTATALAGTVPGATPVGGTTATPAANPSVTPPASTPPATTTPGGTTPGATTPAAVTTSATGSGG
jgi:Tfp pilus assembly protein PilN